MPMTRLRLRPLHRILLGITLLTGALGVPASASAQAPAATGIPATIDCAALAHAQDWGGIPDAPTQITATTAVTASGTDPAYCKITGYVAPQVQFELHLPTTTWSGEYFESGCSGLCGSLNNSPECTAALDRNMATGYTDLGHEGMGGQWGANDGQLRVDFAYRANHVLAVVAKAVINAYYGQAPRYAFFVGCSDGGREALMEAQRFPDDFNGIVAGASAAFFTALNGINQPWKGRANYDAGGNPILTTDKLPVLHTAVINACDGLDGIMDGIIADPRACQFDPASLQCPNDMDAANCLTAAQIGVVRKLYSGPVDAGGTHLYPGGLQYGSELQWAGLIIVPAGSTSFFLGVGNDFVRYLSQPLPQPLDVTASTIPFTVAQLDSYRAMGQLYNATNPDLSAFRDRGGKLILYHGWSDPHIPPTGTIAYYAAVQQQMGGPDATRQFTRLFLFPGMGHCGGGAAPTHFDMTAAITAWVEQGAAPDQIIATQYSSDTDAAMGMGPMGTSGGQPSGTTGVSGMMSTGGMMPLTGSPVSMNLGTVVRTRPVFPYPLMAQYTGMGSSDDASNFVPAMPASPPNDAYDWAGKSSFFTPPAP